MVKAFGNNSLDIWRVNYATITLVPKRKDANEIGHYRPNSVINAVTKIISKLLAYRLQPYMTKLVSPLRTTFTKGRTIMESLMVAREVINFYKKSRIPAIFYKVDFSRAFDSVSWGFLTNVMIERGFSPLRINWILNLLKSSSSLRINGTASERFMHTKELRQEDPLSPMLFILVADALQAFLNNASHMLVGPIIVALKALQFADNTSILTEAHPRNLRIIVKVLDNSLV